jgi:tetratricopeptide (TPR) repeat protein
VPEADYQTSLDDIWRKLRPHLELTEGFALAVLFTRHPAPVDALCKRLQELLSVNTLPLRKFVLQQPEQLDSTLIAVLTSRPLNGKRPPLWLEMWRDVGSEEQRKEQRRAVWMVLSRLNERRFLLERDVACPLVLILPSELRMDIPSMAPDLWSVRSFTADLPAPAVVPQEARAEVNYAPSVLASSREASAAELEWQRLWEATANKQRLAAEAAFAAIDAALERMDYAAARKITDQVLGLLPHDDAAEPNALRRYSIALHYSGDVDKELGRLEEARAAYAESLELRRRLREALGDAPQTLRDLSVSLDNVGGVDKELGRLEEARAAYAESREIRTRLAKTFPDVPQYRKDLAFVEKRIAALEQPSPSIDS